MSDLIPIEDNSAFYGQLKSIEGNEYYVIEIKIITSQGAYKWVECSFRKSKNNIQGFMIDITEKKKYELVSNRDNQFLEKLIDSIPVGIIAKNGKSGLYEVWKQLSIRKKKLKIKDTIPVEHIS